MNFRNFMVAVAIAVVAISCDQTPKTTVLSGQIDNIESDSVYVAGLDSRKGLALNNGVFNDTLNLTEPGYYRFQAGNQYTQIYLVPGEDLVLNTDMGDFDKVLKYDGDTREINNYIAARMLLEEETTKNPNEFFVSEPDQFLEKVTAFKNNMLGLLDGIDANNTFKDLEKKNIEYKYYTLLLQYPNAFKFFAKKDMEMPDDFKKTLDAAHIDNEQDFVEVPAYRDFALMRNAEKIDKAANGDEVIKILDEVKSPKIKDALLADLVMYKIASGDVHAEQLNQYLQANSQDEKLKKMAAEQFETVKKLLPGSPSPKFVYPDINGEDVALDDLKGKLVYIDVWATWCVPCLQEIPSLKQLADDYNGKDVAFVSMSIDPKKDFNKWENMVKEKELKGIQIFADKDWSSEFVRNYNINGIPRFILVDKEGNILNADAPRPSNPEIRTLLDENI